MQTDERILLSHAHMSGREQAFIREAFDTNWICALGPNVDAFEAALAAYVGAPYALALDSGTSALHLSLKYLGVGPGDTVFCSSLTFAASANPIVYLGARPVFIDSDRATWNMDPKALEIALSDAAAQGRLPRAVEVVDLYGQSADMDPLMELCAAYGVPLLEDAAEALGATYKGRFCGTLGVFGAFSFNGNKIITTSTGGMIVSGDREGIEKMRYWSTQSRQPAPHYQHTEIGYNYRMSNVLAGIGRGQMEVLGERVARRRAVYEMYRRGLEGCPLSLMPQAPFGTPTCWLTVALLDRDAGRSPMDVINLLAARNIESRPVWKPMHLQPVFAGCPYHTAGEDVSADLFARGFCLPSGTGLSDAQIEKIIGLVRSAF